MKPKKNKLVILFLYWVGAFALSFVLIFYKFLLTDYFNNVEFLFTFIGVLIGLALTLFTHIVSILERVSGNIKVDEGQSDDKKKNKLDTVNKIYDELWDNIQFLFVSLVLVVLTTLSSGILSQLKVLLPCFFSSDHTLLILFTLKRAFLLSIFILCMLAIKDIIAIALKLSKFIINSIK